MIPDKIKAIFDISQNWIDFSKNLTMLSKKDKGDCFEWLIKFYLLLHPKYRTKLKNVWLLNFEHIPPEVRNHLNLPSGDEGIDLIAETKEGHFWAIQGKYRQDENHSLNRKELSTFTDLAFNICRNISHALICTNSSKVSHKFSLYQDNVSFCASDIWCNLDTEFFENIKEFFQGKIVAPQKIDPRKHQRAALNSAISYFKENRRGKLIHPCSSGKTLTAYWMARELKAKSILVAVPSLSLVNQTLEEWANRFIADNLDVSWICVCSDHTVGKIDIDGIEITAQDLGIEIITDPKVISDWLTNNKSEIKVIFSTYQSGLALAEAARNSSFVFDFAVMDEAHRTVGQKGGLFTHLLSDENINISKRLFMTATERRFRGSSDKILSMDQENVYGQTIHLYTFKEAIEDKVLCDYKIATIYVTEEEVKALIEGNFYLKPIGNHWEKEVESQILASTIALRKAYKKYGFSHAISYHNSLARASAFKETQTLYGKTLLQTDPLCSFHIAGTTPAGLRKELFQNFSNASMGLMTNVRCLTEGVNIPKIDSILFADPKKSKIDITQAVGRALRPYEGKKMSYIVVPVLINETSDNVESIKNKTYAALLLLIRSLATQDERIIEYFQALPNKPKRGIPRDYSPFEVDIPISIDINLAIFQNSIELSLLDKIAKLSWKPFAGAKDFVHSLGLENYNAWKAYCNGDYPDLPEKPHDIPRTPWIVYEKLGWTSMGDWLGTGFIATSKRQYRPFLQARSFVQNLGLKSQAEWVRYCRNDFPEKGLKPEDIPYDPATVYKDDGWIDLGDWLGTRTIATRNLKYRTFEDARAFAVSLNLKTQTDWKDYCQGKLPQKGLKPKDIPTNPNVTYQKKGWVNFGHWLGTGYVSPRYRQYRPYESAKDFARSLGLNSYKEWRLYCEGNLTDKPRKPDDIPAKPDDSYKNNGWTSWADFLGTENISNEKKNFLPYEISKAIIHKLKLRNQDDWKEYCQGTNPRFGIKPDNIPKAPAQFYKEWTSWGVWLGTGYVACSRRKYRSFEEARSFVQSLGLKGQSEWRRYTKGSLERLPPLPSDIPANPNQTYKHRGWKGFGDWFGTGIIAPRLRKYRSFQEARHFVQQLGLKNQKEWLLYARNLLPNHSPKPSDIPAHPRLIYKNQGWKGDGDWIGSGFISYSKRDYLPFNEARAFVHKLQLKNSTEWHAYCNHKFPEKPSKPFTISNRPEITYKKKGWINWGDWLGISYIPTRREYKTFAEARLFVQSLKLTTLDQWRRYCQTGLPGKPKLPLDIPLKPERAYKDNGWAGYPDWLGNSRRASPKFNAYLSFHDAKTYVQTLALKNVKEWGLFCKGKLLHLGSKPQNIPTHPERAYAQSGWQGYGDWLGTNNPSPLSRQFLSYEEAKKFVYPLNLKSRNEWHRYCSGKLPNKPKLPNNIPRDPNSVYKSKGWLGVGDWLGTNQKATHLRSYLSFVEARSFVRNLGLKTGKQWRSYCKGDILLKTPLPDNIPKAPWIVYEHIGWICMPDWLGTIDEA
jgi:superfamily II DNA or RNA helicase